MPANYLHGVETVEVLIGSRPVQIVKSSVIALVGTAPTGPENELSLVLNARDAAKFGNKIPGFTIPYALDAIFTQGAATVVVVNTFNNLLNTTQVLNENTTVTNAKATLANVPVSDLSLSNSPSVSGETKATATLTVTDKGTDGVTTYVYAQDPYFGYFKVAEYTKISGDGTNAAVATAIAAAINAGTSGHGYSASASSNVVTVTVRAGLGTAANGNYLYSYFYGTGGVSTTGSNFAGGAVGSATITNYVKGIDYDIDTLGNIVLLAGTSITEGQVLKASYKRLNAGSVTNAQIIGDVKTDGSRTGLKAFELCYNTFGFKPKVMIAPGFSHIEAIAVQLVAAATKYRAIAPIDAPEGTTLTQAITGRGPLGNVGGFNTSNKRAIPCFPMATISDNVTNANINFPLSAYYAGIVAYTDLNEGFHVSPSNHEIKGIVGMEFPVVSDYTDSTSESNLLNEKGICTLFNSYGTGIRLWGNRNASFPTNTAPDSFVAVQRTRDILQESIEFAMLDYLDKPILRATIDAICETVNQFIRVLVGRGALIDGNCSYDPSKNPNEEVAAGHLVFDLDFLPPSPAERITFNSYIDISLLKALVI